MKAGQPCADARFGVYRDGRLLSVWSTEEQARSFCYPGWGRYVLPLIWLRPRVPVLSWVANDDGAVPSAAAAP